MAGAGQPVVLVHGLTLDTRSWDGQFATLAANYRAIRYDARGHDKSIRQLDTPYSLSGDLRGLLDALGVDGSRNLPHPPRCGDPAKISIRNRSSADPIV